MAIEDTMEKVDRINAITLKGREYEAKEGDLVSLQAKGALLTVRRQDILGSRDTPDGEKEILISRDAKVIYEALLHPEEAESILSQNAAVELVGSAARNRCVECSRCTGGECECSRCIDTRINRCVECSRCAGGECECSRCIDTRINRCVECSRCTGGECECSRCTDIRIGFEQQFGSNVFRRRLS